MTILPQWAGGQLSNIHQIEDPSLVKQSLLQVILALRNATSLPWQAVRNAWVHSMHDVEEGHLTWADNTQWSLNRLSNSESTMVNVQAVSQKKVCKYYNEGHCSHEGNHGQSKHVCAYCSRQGRNSVHPENKCNFKTEGRTETLVNRV